MKKIIALLITSLLVLCSHAEEKKVEPSKVFVGIYLENVNSISYSKNSYQVDFTLWFRWSDKNIHPNKTFKIKNAKIDSRKDVFSGMVNDGKDYLEVVDVSATFNTQWDINDYPFDNQTLKIGVEEDEDDPATNSIYVVDEDNIKPSKELEIPAWKVRSEKSFVTCNTFDTNYGNPALKDQKSCSTQFNHYVEIEKKSELIGFKLLVAPIIAVLLMMFVVLLPALEGPRMGVPGTALFVLVSCSFIIVNQLPPSEGFSYAEKLISFGLLQCLLHLCMTVVSMKYLKDGKVEKSQRLDRILLEIVVVSNLIFGAYTAYVISL
jgi:hypothetical protein